MNLIFTNEGSMNHSGPSFSRSQRAWAVAFALPWLSLVILRPWIPEAFPVWDWPEIVVLFRDSDGLLGTLRSLAEYYGAQGRANLLTYFQLALTWSLVGESAVGWQLQRAIVMLGLGALFVDAGRRAGATPAITGLGSLILLLSVSSVEGWLFLTGEPLGACLLICFYMLAARYGAMESWRLGGALLGLLAVGVLFTKEVLGVCLPPLVLVALCTTREGCLIVPRWNPRTRWLVVVLLAALALKLFTLVLVMNSMATDAYATAYGEGGLALPRIGVIALTMTLPAWFFSSRAGALVYPANLLAGFLLICGAAAAYRSGWKSRRVKGMWLLALVPMAGAVVYALWPRYAAFYGIPFFTASAALLVAGVECLAHRGQVRSIWLVASLALVAGYLGIVADRTVREKYALAAVTEEIARVASTWPSTDSVLVVAPPDRPRYWPTTARELERYGTALRLTEHGAVYLDVDCQGALDRLRHGLARAALVADPQACGRLPVKTGRHEARYRYLDWISLTWVENVLVVESLVPGLVSQ